VNDAGQLVERVTDAWLEDPESAVVWAGYHEGRRGVRMRQTVRDMTTVWFAVGQRTVTIEAYVLPKPPQHAAEVYRQALARNAGTRRMSFALDRLGDLVIVGKIPVDHLSEVELDLALGEVYDLVEVAFPGLVRAAFDREKKPPE
jgi:hypothetical protein